jgi:hypothetical protein
MDKKYFGPACISENIKRNFGISPMPGDVILI